MCATRRALGRLPDQGVKADLRPALSQLLRIAAEGGTAWPGVAEEQAQQPTQASVLAMQAPRFADGIAAEIQPDHLEAQAGEQRGFVAASASRNEHRPLGLGCPGVVLKKSLQWRSGLAQLPAVLPLPLARIPCLGQVHVGHSKTLAGPVHTQVRLIPFAERKGPS